MPFPIGNRKWKMQEIRKIDYRMAKEKHAFKLILIFISHNNMKNKTKKEAFTLRAPPSRWLLKLKIANNNRLISHTLRMA